MARRDSAGAAALDPALTQKKRARRRLVGALVLGIAAAIVLPLVLDSEPRQAITDVQIEIPPRDAPLPPRSSDDASGSGHSSRSDEALVPPPEPTQADAKAAGTRSAEAVDAPAKDVPAKDTLAKDGAGASVAAQAAAASVAGGSHPPEARPAEPKPEPKPESRPEPKPESKTQSKTVESKTQTKASPSGAKSPAPAPAAKPSAEAAKPAASSASPASARDATGATGFALQVGAFANAGSARAQVDKVRKAGLRVYTEQVQTAQGARTRVRVGPFASREAAEQARASLKRAGIDSAVVGP